MRDRGSKKKLTFVVNHVAFFVSHRLPIAHEALRRGWEVQLFTGQTASETMEAEAMEALAESGIEHRRFSFGSPGLNPLKEVWGLVRLWWQLRKDAPELVHCASPLGLMYGGLAARLARVPSLVLAVSGMGYAFTQSGRRSLRRAALRTAYLRLVRAAYAHPNKRVIVQNREDERWVVAQQLAVPGEVQLIAGSGVDPAVFAPPGDGVRQNLIVFPARLLKDKGLLEFIEAARLLRHKVQDWRFVLAGAADYRNPSSVPRQTIEAWVSEGIVDWNGHVRDMAALLSRTSIVCLPSYREGMPKVLLEGAAAGCAVVTTDVTGCRDAVIPGVTGDLVPVRDTAALADCMFRLIREPVRREAYGRSGRLLAMERFSLHAVLQSIFSVYDSLDLNGRPERQ